MPSLYGAAVDNEGLHLLEHVSFVGSALLSIVPAAVQRFRRSRPGVEVELRERSTTEQLRALSTGVVDVALVRPPIQSDIDVHLHEVMRERTIVAIRLVVISG